MNSSGISFKIVREPVSIKPEEFIDTPEKALAAAKTNPIVLAFLPDDLMTEEVCVELVRQFPCELMTLPNNRKTQKVCIEAISKDVTLVLAAPSFARTEDFCRTLVESNLITSAQEDEFRRLVGLPVPLWHRLRTTAGALFR